MRHKHIKKIALLAENLQKGHDFMKGLKGYEIKKD